MIPLFSVDFVSPVEFENLAAEISYGGQLICRIKDEHPAKLLEAEFFFEVQEPLLPVVVPVAELLELIGDVSDELQRTNARLP